MANYKLCYQRTRSSGTSKWGPCDNEKSRAEWTVGYYALSGSSVSSYCQKHALQLIAEWDEEDDSREYEPPTTIFYKGLDR
jgi:hypothetical protein